MHNFLIHNINKRIARSLPYKGRVIDLGCGINPYKEDILKVADEYIGVDWENSYHKSSQVDVRADLTKSLPFDDEYADPVVSFQVMEHLPEPGFFLSECHRILKRGGNLFITVPFMWHIHDVPYDYYRYTRYGLEYMLKKNSFVDIVIEENTGFWQMWTLKFNYHTTRFARGPLKYFWISFWQLGQVVTQALDSYDRNLAEYGSYTVIAMEK